MFTSLFRLVLGLALVGQVMGEEVTPSSPAPPAPASAKRVEIDKGTQTLRAFEGDQLFLESRVSTGKEGKGTPSKAYAVDQKEEMHRSKLYHNAKMPFAVHLGGNIFIHGYKSVPEEPASHGCIRLPLGDGEAAKRFYDWVEIGTPVNISGKWEGDEERKK